MPAEIAVGVGAGCKNSRVEVDKISFKTLVSVVPCTPVAAQLPVFQIPVE